MRLADAVNIYEREIARRCTDSTAKKYGMSLGYFLDDYEHKPLGEITQEDVEQWLDRWATKARSTLAQHTTVIKCFFRFLAKRGHIPVDPAVNIDRPKLPRPEDKDVVVVSTPDMARLFAACRDWGDEICLSLLAHTAVRRNAASMLRWRDVDLRGTPNSPNGWMKFYEKGTKVKRKPIDEKLRFILDRAPDHGPDDYVVPNIRPELVRKTERDNRIIYNRVKRIAERAGVKAHVHSIRAAFAVYFLESGRGSVAQLQKWLGHDRLDTTQIYLRGLEDEMALTGSLGMDWGALSEAGESRTGAGGSIPQTVGEGAAPKPTPVSLSALTEGEWPSPSGPDSSGVVKTVSRVVYGTAEDSDSSSSSSESALTEGNVSGEMGRPMKRPSLQVSAGESDPQEPVVPSVSAPNMPDILGGQNPSDQIGQTGPGDDRGVCPGEEEHSDSRCEDQDQNGPGLPDPTCPDTDTPKARSRVPGKRSRYVFTAGAPISTGQAYRERLTGTGHFTGKEVAGTTRSDRDSGMSQESKTAPRRNEGP